MNWQSLLSGIGSAGNFMQGLSGLFGGGGGSSSGGSGLGSLLQSLLGSGLFAAGAAPGLNQMPGYATDAIQYLRNQFTSPDAIAKNFAGQIGALQSQYQPLIDQQVNTLLNDIQQRSIAGQPSSFSTAMSGPEIGAIRTATQNQLLPGIQAHLADLGQFLLGQQTSSARDLLQFAKPNPLGGALSQLGASMMGGQGGGGGGGGIPAITNYLQSLFGGGGGAGGGAGAGGGGYGLDASSLGLGGSPYDQVPSGSTGFSGIDQIINQLMGGGQGGAGAAGAGGGVGAGAMDFGLPGAGLLGPSGLSSLQGLFSSLGAGGAGYGLGSIIGPNLPNQATGALGGAGVGALSGFALGGPVGALIGALAGGAGGFFGKRQKQLAQKAANLQADISSQSGQIQQIGSFFENALSQAGVSSGDFQQFVSQQLAQSESGALPFSFGGVSGTLDQQDAVAQVGGRMLLQAFQSKNPSLTSLNQVPGLRQNYISFLTNTTFSAGNSSYGGGAPLDAIGRWSDIAGLQTGGLTTKPTMAMVGEQGPEMAMLSPGSMVMPMSGGLSGIMPQGNAPQLASNAQQGVVPLQMLLQLLPQLMQQRRPSPLLGGMSYA